MIKRILALLMVVAFVVTMATGCTNRISKSSEKDNDEKDKQTVSVNTDWINPKPIEHVTLVAMQATIPEGTTLEGHKVEFEIPAELDTSWEPSEYYNYSVKYSLNEHKMQEAAVKKKLDPIYSGVDATYTFLQTGDTVFQVGENKWGIIKDVRVKALSENGWIDESFRVVLFGLEEDDTSATSK